MADPNGTPRTARFKIALMVTGASVIGIILVSGVLLICAEDTDEAGRLIFASVLPLLGSWVGTVLAFYFSRENLEAATTSVESLTRLSREERLKQIKAVDVMIPLARMTVQYIVKGDEKSIVLKDLAASKWSRHPILETDTNRPFHLVHRSVIDRFIARKAQAGGADLTKLTLADLLADDEMKAMVAFGTVDPEASLAEAKRKLDGDGSIQDVFVTEDGGKTSAVRGWLPNVRIGKALNA